MSNGDRGTTLLITAGGPNPPSVSNVNISFSAPVTVLGGTIGFSGVPPGNEVSAQGGFTPTAQGGISLGGSYAAAMIMALVSVPTGNTIAGTISSDPALPFPLKVQSFIDGSTYTLEPGQTSGEFSFPFTDGSTGTAAGKGIV